MNKHCRSKIINIIIINIIITAAAATTTTTTTTAAAAAAAAAATTATTTSQPELTFVRTQVFVLATHTIVGQVTREVQLEVRPVRHRAVPLYANLLWCGAVVVEGVVQPGSV